MRGRPWARAVAVGAALVAAPGLAHAHLVDTGFGAFYDGFVHLFVTPEDLLPVLALSLWAGLRGTPYGRALLLVLPSAWLAGCLLGLAGASPLAAGVTGAAMTIALGALTAADARLPRGWIIAAAVLLGLLSGGLNGVVLARAGLGLPGGAGIACGVFAVVALAAAQVASLRADWTRVTVRVMGSWVAATGLLMLGWTLRA